MIVRKSLITVSGTAARTQEGWSVALTGGALQPEGLHRSSPVVGMPATVAGCMALYSNAAV